MSPNGLHGDVKSCTSSANRSGMTGWTPMQTQDIRRIRFENFRGVHASLRSPRSASVGLSSGR
eukprot:1896938-Pyramimonas_sp.AAC.1